MICYRDMTFCTGDGCTKFNDCPRALNEQVRVAAARWWGEESEYDAPIARFANPKELSCYQAPEDKTPNQTNP